MALLRKQLRDAAKAAIAAGVPELSNRVSGVRAYPRNRDQVPAAQVSTPSEDSERTSSDGVLSVEITLDVVLFTLGASGGEVEDDLDALAEKAHAALVDDATILSLTDEFLSVTSSFEFGDGASEVPASLTLSFVAMALITEADVADA